jgi:hypothetical protein
LQARQIGEVRAPRDIAAADVLTRCSERNANNVSGRERIVPSQQRHDNCIKDSDRPHFGGVA